MPIMSAMSAIEVRDAIAAVPFGSKLSELRRIVAQEGAGYTYDARRSIVMLPYAFAVKKAGSQPISEHEPANRKNIKA